MDDKIKKIIIYNRAGEVIQTYEFPEHFFTETIDVSINGNKFRMGRM